MGLDDEAMKMKLEEKYSVRVSIPAVQIAIKSKLIPGDEKVDNILDAACKLVLERLRNSDYENKFHERAYELHRALVELIELKRDTHPDSKSWVKRLKQERDSASIKIGRFLEKWERVSMFSAENLKSKIVNSNSFDNKNTTGQFLDDVQDQLIECFQRQLTVNPCHVAEVVSRLTDVPVMQILTDHRFVEKGKYKTKQRVVDQDHVIDQIFDTLGSEDHMPTRPRASFLLLGPPGVGKTEIAKAVAEHWYCDASRLVKIDVSVYADTQLLCARLMEALERRPFSVILMDKIDKAASSVAETLLLVLNNQVLPVDFSKSIVFMTSSVGTDQLEPACKETRGCASERAICEARKLFGSQLVNSFDKVIVVEKFRNQKAVARLLLREIARDVGIGKRIVVHASDVALDILLDAAAASSTESVGTGMAIKRLLHERIVPQLSTAQGYNYDNVVICVDALLGTTHELSFRYKKGGASMDDRYFGHKKGTFGECMANLRIKVELACNVLESRRKCLLLLSSACDQNFSQLKELLSVCDSISLFSPCPNSSPPATAFKETSNKNNLLSDEAKKKIKNQWITLHENIGGVAKATCLVLETVLKVSGAQSESLGTLARHYLFLGLDDDATRALVNGLTESFRSNSAKSSLFKHIKLDDNCSGEIQRKSIIEEVKEKPCMVILFDGVEFADEVLYSTLLEIFDEGALSNDDDDDGDVDFRKAIVILTSAAFPKDVLASHFNYRDEHVPSNIGTNEIVRRFRTELIQRVDEIVYFDPLVPTHGDIVRDFCGKDRRRMLSSFHHLFKEIEQ